MFDPLYLGLNAQLAAIVSGSGGTYALIETITVGAGGATSIERTEEPDETPYAFVGIMIDVHLVGVLSSTGDITIALSGDSVALTPYTTTYEFMDGTDLYFRYTLVQEHGIWKAGGVDFDTSQTYAIVVESLADPIFAADCAAIDTVSITSTAGLPENSVIKIYGIRAPS